MKPVGLGARDSLRLEAGLCLYGHDIDETTTPVEADLGWTVGKRRRAEGGFPGAAVILRQLAEGAPRKRVGIRPDGRAPAREGAAILDHAGNAIGRGTSGGFGPSVGAPVAMGYVDAADAAEGMPLFLDVRGTARPARVARLPFVPHRYHRPHPPLPPPVVGKGREGRVLTPSSQMKPEISVKEGVKQMAGRAPRVLRDSRCAASSG